jgi:cytochrome c551/c552
MRRLTVGIALGGLALIGTLQLIRFDRTNPSVTADLQAPSDVKSVLRRSCYDCHSNETVWPWYSAVAPMSWLLHYDVTAGRESLNFSRWGALSREEQTKQRKEIAEAVAEGEMPPWYYVPMHPSARLTDAEKRFVEMWATSGE